MKLLCVFFYQKVVGIILYLLNFKAVQRFDSKLDKLSNKLFDMEMCEILAICLKSAKHTFFRMYLQFFLELRLGWNFVFDH